MRTSGTPKLACFPFYSNQPKSFLLIAIPKPPSLSPRLHTESQTQILFANWGSTCADIFRIGDDESGQPLAHLQIKVVRAEDRVSVFSETSYSTEQNILLGRNFPEHSGHQRTGQNDTPCQNTITTNVFIEITLLTMYSCIGHHSDKVIQLKD